MPMRRSGKQGPVRLSFLVALSFFCLGCIYFYVHSRVRNDNVSIDWHRAYSMVSYVEFEVFDSEGNPIPGVAVNCDTTSGWQQAARTDTSGRATLNSGEREIIAISLNNVEAFRDERFIDQLVGPSTGMRIRIVVKNPSMFKITDPSRADVTTDRMK